MNNILVILALCGLFLIDDFRIQRLENRIRRLEKETNLLDIIYLNKEAIDKLVIKKFDIH